MKIVKKILQSIGASLLWSIPLFVSFIIYSNSLETIMNKDITVLAEAIETYNEYVDSLGEYKNNINEPNLTGNAIGDYGKPVSLLLPNINRKIEIVPAVVNDNYLLSRPNNVHFLTKVNESGYVDGIFLYVKQSWRTIPDAEDLDAEGNIYIDTNREWRYVFAVDEIIQGRINDYKLPESRNTQLLLMIKDQNNNETYLLRATYRTIIPIGR